MKDHRRSFMKSGKYWDRESLSLFIHDRIHLKTWSSLSISILSHLSLCMQGGRDAVSRVHLPLLVDLLFCKQICPMSSCFTATNHRKNILLLLWTSSNITLERGNIPVPQMMNMNISLLFPHCINLIGRLTVSKPTGHSVVGVDPIEWFEIFFIESIDLFRQTAGGEVTYSSPNPCYR